MNSFQSFFFMTREKSPAILEPHLMGYVSVDKWLVRLVALW